MKKEKNKAADISSTCLNGLSQLGELVMESAISGGYYAVRGAKLAAEKGVEIAGQISPKIRTFIYSRQKVGMKEYIRRHRAPPNVLVKVPGPVSGDTDQQVISEIGKVLSDAAEQDDADNLTIVNLDSYFKKLK